jgi:hypothetical protein
MQRTQTLDSCWGQPTQHKAGGSVRLTNQQQEGSAFPKYGACTGLLLPRNVLESRLRLGVITAN